MLLIGSLSAMWAWRAEACQKGSTPTQREPSRNWKPYSLKSTVILFRCLALNQSPEPAPESKGNSLFANVSHQTRLDTRSKSRRPIKVGIKRMGRSGTSRDSNPAGLCCSSAHLVQYEPEESSSFMNPNVGPGTYARWWLELGSNV